MATFDQPLVDTHLHLWDPQRVSYPWMSDVPRLHRRFDLASFDEHRAGTEVEKMVFLECGVPVEALDDEVAFVTGLADEDPRLAGMVFGAPLEQGTAVRERLDGYRADPRVKGVRRLLQDEEDPRFCLRPDFVSAVQLLGELDLQFEACIYHPQLAGVVELARRCPDTRILLDHLGKPGIKDGLLDPWRGELEQLAGLPNTWCKVSGLVTEADHQRWTNEDLRPYVDHALACFGPERVMFGGDWPVATLATDYPRWVHTLSELTAGRSADDRRKLFRDNAIEFYRLA